MDSKHSAIELKAVTLANRITVIAVTVISTIIGVAYLAEAIKHNRTWAYVLSVFGIAIVALPAGIITAGYLDTLNEEKKKSEKQ